MKNYLKTFIFTALSIILLAACSPNDSDNVDNLIDINNVTEGVWTGYDGDDVEDEEMITTELIPYDSETDYEINRSSYVSYFNGDEFIKNKLYDENMPLTLETVGEADAIKISFNQYNKNTIELVEK